MIILCLGFGGCTCQTGGNNRSKAQYNIFSKVTNMVGNGKPAKDTPGKVCFVADQRFIKIFGSWHKANPVLTTLKRNNS